MPLHAAQGRSGVEGDFRLVGVVDVPDVGLLGHAQGLLLESKLGVRAGQSVFRPIHLPGNFSNCPLDLVGVLEDHERFGVDLLTHVFSLLSRKVFLEHVNFVVLLHASFGSASEVSGGGGESKCRVSVELLVVTLDVLLILRIDLMTVRA